MNTKFEINKIYSVQTNNYYFGETCGEFNGYIYANYKCIKRTNKTVTFKEGCLSNNITAKIRIDDNGNEYVYLKEAKRIINSK